MSTNQTTCHKIFRGISHETKMKYLIPLLLILSQLVSNIQSQDTQTEDSSSKNGKDTEVGKGRGTLINHPACRKDFLALSDECQMAKSDFENDFAALTCAQSLTQEKFEFISETCEQVLWRFKLNMTKSPIFLKQIEKACDRDKDRLKMCSNQFPIKEDAGHYMSCLMQEKLNPGLKPQCYSFLNQVNSPNKIQLYSVCFILLFL